MKIRCPGCGRSRDVPAEAIVKNARCKHCQTTFRVCDALVSGPAASLNVPGGETRRPVFISYSVDDGAVAETVCREIEAKGIPCWIAPRNVDPGREYAEAIIDAIHESSVLVLVFSGKSNVSKQVLREVERAVSFGNAIVPFRIENCKPTKSLEYFLSVPHWLDAFTGPLETHIEHLATVLRGMLTREAPAQHVSTLAEAPRPISYSPTLLPDWERKLNDGEFVEVLDCGDEIAMQDLRKVLRHTLKSQDLDEFCIQNCEVALIELCRNVSRHAAVAIARLEIAFSIKYKRFLLSVSSKGAAFTLDKALAKYNSLPESQRTIHGLQNLLQRGVLEISNDGTWNTVKFSTNVVLRRSFAAEKLPLHLEPSTVTVGNRVFSYSEWLHVNEQCDVAELLLSQWKGEGPCQVSVVYEPPEWTKTSLEFAAMDTFKALASSIASNSSFVVDPPARLALG